MAFFPALAFGSTATRYLADLLPFLWVGACIGSQSLLADERLRVLRRRRSLRTVAVAAVAVLALASVVVNGSAGLVQQRLLAPTTTAAERASFVRAQDDVDRFLGRAPHGVHHGTTVPSRSLGPAGDLFVLGRCDGLYVQGFNGSWLPVERSARSGLHELRVRFPAPAGSAAPPVGAPAGGGSAAPQALLTLGAGPRRVTVVTLDTTRGIVFSIRVGGRTVATGRPIAIAPRSPRRLTVSIDPLNGAWFLSVSLPGVPAAVVGSVPYQRLATAVLGSDPGQRGLAHFSGTESPVPVLTPVCDEVAGRAGLL